MALRTNRRGRETPPYIKAKDTVARTARADPE
jgi:hypothetical protein